MILEVKNLKKKFGDEDVLKDISFNVEEGDIICILGSSGSGKSTLLRCINFLETPNSGDIFFNGINTKNMNINELRTKIGMVFQSFNLFNNLNVLKNCMIGQTKVLRRTKEEAKEIATKELIRVGMKEYLDKSPKQLSGGQMQRVAIARALSNSPSLILFDEPTSALDPEMVGEVLSVIKEVKKTGITMVIVTHEMQFAKEVSTRILFMNDGVILEDSRTEDFFKNPKTDRAKDFIKRFMEQ